MFKKLLFQKKSIIGILFLLIISCSGNDNGDDLYVPPIESTVIIPSNFSLEINIVGKDASNPNGDGSGKIQCVIKATNAVKYGFRFGTGTKIDNTTGIMEHTFTGKGTNTYTVYAYAYSTTGHAINTSKEITVQVGTGSSSGLKLIWADEFDVEGALNSNNWFHQTQLPAGGNWYNNEVQHYTNRMDNSYVSNGTLKIVAKKESFTDQGYTKQYTSARLNSKFAFTYGRVEVRAKLPTGVGTWPAIWLLGKNINENGGYWDNQGFGTTNWPACGEVDIMEHWGSNQNFVQSAMHTPSSSGGTINHGGQTITTVSSQFHTYVLEWTSEKMVFSVDGLVHYTYNPSPKNLQTWPFDLDQYILLNIAIEPSINTSFVQSSMEIDFVRVYQ